MLVSSEVLLQGPVTPIPDSTPELEAWSGLFGKIPLILMF